MAAKGSKDRLGDLTDDLLRHVLSLLPPEDALKTCVLDTRWRELWRRTTSMHFDATHCERCEQLVKLFIQLRGNSPLPKCEISTSSDDHPHHADFIYTNTELLIDYALECQVKELLLKADHIDDGAIILDMPLISRHLKILHLEDVTCSALNFSGCQVLEELKMEHCEIYAHKISSKSLKRLCITEQCSVPQEFHIQIFAPDLISLQISNFHGATPFLGDMPFLVTAYIGLCDGCHDSCEKNLRGCDFDECGCHAYPAEGGVLLNGLSNAVHLELIAYPMMFIYQWDLECCPLFGTLKTLLLNEWFTTIDLVCILRCSPLLERLTLQLCDTKNLVGATTSPETIDQSFVCSHLEVVKIECRKVDVGIRKILNILSTFGVDDKKINIKEKCSHSYRFSFEKYGVLLSLVAPEMCAPP
ncbi:hypothetical protein CFC21_089926 [Triticum aestivum]|uniref:F-box domain-containing protein n=2 Tax=Triticum aestivum TaxID=4565 RepID=A0A9R1IMZ9_WHEAT|nr:hypothetical protein CFC21_089923 [Triticum aestivum]KAF7086644.1 hypothetical protein CFC21_089926 [Triticum aestivum]